MTTKEYLSQVYLIDHRINRELEEFKSLHDLATKATSILNDPLVSCSKNNQQMESIILKIVDLENKINNDLDKLIDLKAEITSKIKQIEKPEYQILLELRYLQFKKWEQIAVEMAYSIQHIFRMHAKALKFIKIS